jgi:hypothetical protein
MGPPAPHRQAVAFRDNPSEFVQKFVASQRALGAFALTHFFHARHLGALSPAGSAPQMHAVVFKPSAHAAGLDSTQELPLANRSSQKLFCAHATPSHLHSSAFFL